MDTELIDKLWESTEQQGSHWLWTKHLTPAGQGVVWYNGRDWIVSRLALCIYFKLHYRDNWQANHIDSLCRHRHCWNPLHMYVGTQKDNMIDMRRAGNNHHANKTHCIRGHEFTKENTRYIGRRRECKECSGMHKRKFYLNKKQKEGRVK